jgi:ubiquinone/menaquinone biosynthesis C-methylase UbiE
MKKDIKTTEAYNKIAQEYSSRNHRHFWKNEYDYFKTILAGNKVVDLGCGAGRDAEQFVNDSFDYLGIDASEEMLKIASQRVAEGQFRLMDLRDIDLPLESFDGFWASASLLHFSKQEVPDLLKSFYNLLKDNGVGFISVKEKRVMDEGYIKEDKGGGIERYFSFFHNNEMIKFLEKANFTVIKSGQCFENDKDETEWLYFFVKK